MSGEFNAPNCLKYFLFRYMLNNYLAHYNIKRSSLEGDRLQKRLKSRWVTKETVARKKSRKTREISLAVINIRELFLP